MGQSNLFCNRYGTLESYTRTKRRIRWILFEYEYNTTRPANQAIGDKEKAAIPYYSLRRGIQEQNPAGKPVQQSTKQETEEENG